MFRQWITLLTGTWFYRKYLIKICYSYYLYYNNSFYLFDYYLYNMEKTILEESKIKFKIKKIISTWIKIIFLFKI
jgi:hypothetical protein